VNIFYKVLTTANEIQTPNENGILELG